MNILGNLANQLTGGLPGRTILLATTMSAAYGLVGCAAVAQDGAMGFIAVSLAVGACWASATAALWTSHALLDAGVAGMLLPTLVRTAPPLIVALLVRLRGQALLDTGFGYYLVGFYLLALAVEVPLSLPRGARLRRCVDRPAGKDGQVHG